MRKSEGSGSGKSQEIVSSPGLTLDRVSPRILPGSACAIKWPANNNVGSSTAIADNDKKSMPFFIACCLSTELFNACLLVGIC